MSLHWWTAVNPELELAFDDLKRQRPLPLSVHEALDAQYQRAQLERAKDVHRTALTAQVKEPYHQQALKLYEKVESRKEEFVHRARVRSAIADKLQYDVAPWVARDRGFAASLEYVLLAQKLRDARGFGAYCVDPVSDDDDDGNKELELWWSNRAGLVKLCPDDARWEGRRVGRIYGERLKALDKLGYVLRYAVFTLPNFPQWHLGAGIHQIKAQFKARITHALENGGIARNLRQSGRRFPNLVGALCVIEAPLSGLAADDSSNAWNVHLNVIMVFRPSDGPYGRPDYAALRDAWGSHVHFSMIPQGDPNATRAALKELVKYPLRAVSEKSAEERKPQRDHAGNVLPPAPPMIEWPAAYVDEWWRAHKGLRRTWSCGQLYDDKIEALDGERFDLYTKSTPRSLDVLDVIGPIWLSPTHCDVGRPQLDTRELDRAQRTRAFEHRARMSTDPEYAATVHERERRWHERRENQRRRYAAREALFTFIQGNNSAATDSMPVAELLRARDGPPT